MRPAGTEQVLHDPSPSVRTVHYQIGVTIGASRVSPTIERLNQAGLTLGSRAVSTKIVLVAACALIDADGRVLIAERPAGKPMAGLWEFPGGKVETGERPETELDPGVEGGTGNNRQRSLSGAADFRQPRLSGLSSPDAAICLPALGGNGHRAGRAEACLGETEPAAGVPDAARGCSAGVAPDGAV